MEDGQSVSLSIHRCKERENETEIGHLPRSLSLIILREITLSLVCTYKNYFHEYYLYIMCI